MKKIEHNVATGEIVELDMTAEEIAAFELSIAAVENERTQLEVKANEKSALLAKLGITQEEAKLLLS